MSPRTDIPSRQRQRKGLATKNPSVGAGGGEIAICAPTLAELDQKQPHFRVKPYRDTMIIRNPRFTNIAEATTDPTTSCPAWSSSGTGGAAPRPPGTAAALRAATTTEATAAAAAGPSPSRPRPRGKARGPNPMGQGGRASFWNQTSIGVLFGFDPQNGQVHLFHEQNFAL